MEVLAQEICEYNRQKHQKNSITPSQITNEDTTTSIPSKTPEIRTRESRRKKKMENKRSS
jgi:hypothetical protein